MNSAVRAAIARILVILIAIAGAVTAAEPVLCVGPGSHCHLESPIGAGCEGQAAPRQEAPLRDGCPRGSKDITLKIDKGRSGGEVAFLAPALALMAASIVIGARHLRESEPPITLGVEAVAARNSMTILRC